MRGRQLPESWDGRITEHYTDISARSVLLVCAQTVSAFPLFNSSRFVIAITVCHAGSGMQPTLYFTQKGIRRGCYLFSFYRRRIISGPQVLNIRQELRTSE